MNLSGISIISCIQFRLFHRNCFKEGNLDQNIIINYMIIIIESEQSPAMCESESL